MAIVRFAGGGGRPAANTVSVATTFQSVTTSARAVAWANSASATAGARCRTFMSDLGIEMTPSERNGNPGRTSLGQTQFDGNTDRIREPAERPPPEPAKRKSWR